MNPSDECLPGPETAGTKRPRRRLTGLRGQITLVACCGLLAWTGSVVWKYYDSALAAERAYQARALRALRSRNATERLNAVRDLRQVGHADTSIEIRPLIAMLRDEDLGVRVASVEALGVIGARAVRTGSDDAAVRAAVSALIGVRNDPQPGMRTAVVLALGAMTSAMPGTGTDLRAGLPPPGRRKAALAPAAVATPVDIQAVIAALTEAIGDREAGVRRAAITALADVPGLLDPPRALAATLEDESAGNRKATVMALGRFRRGLDPWISSLLRIAEHDDDRSVRDQSVGVLSESIKPPAITTAAVPALAAGLASRDRQVRIAAAHALGQLGRGADAALPALLRAFTEPIDGKGTGLAIESRAAQATAQALGQIAPGSASARGVVTTLTDVVRSGKSIRRAPAALALGAFGPAAAPAIPDLIRMADEAGPTHAAEDQFAATWALGRIAPGTAAADEAVAALTVLLRSDQPATRIAAIDALGRFGPKAAASLPKLRALRDDPDIDVKRTVTRVLEVLEVESEP